MTLSSLRRQDELAGNLSGGQQQILEMAMALMLHPEVLLIDEPTLGLSPIMVAEIFAAIDEINRTGTTVLMVEQNAKQHWRLRIAASSSTWDECASQARVRRSC